MHHSTSAHRSGFCLCLEEVRLYSWRKNSGFVSGYRFSDTVSRLKSDAPLGAEAAKSTFSATPSAAPLRAIEMAGFCVARAPSPAAVDFGLEFTDKSPYQPLEDVTVGTVAVASQARLWCAVRRCRADVPAFTWSDARSYSACAVLTCTSAVQYGLPRRCLCFAMFYGLATAVWLHAPSRLASRRMIRICTVSPGKSMYITCFSSRTGTGLLAESAKRKSSPSDT